MICFLTRRLCFEKKKILQLEIEKRSLILKCDVPFGEVKLKLYFFLPEINKLRSSNASSTALVLSSPIFLKITSNVLTLPCSILCDRQETLHGMAPRRLVSQLVISLKRESYIFIKIL